MANQALEPSEQLQFAVKELPDPSGFPIGTVRTVQTPSLPSTPVEIVDGKIREVEHVDVHFKREERTIDNRPTDGWTFEGAVRVDANDRRWALEMGGLDIWLRSRMPLCHDLTVLHERGTSVHIRAFFVPRAG
jgi:hypothetical protein